MNYIKIQKGLIDYDSNRISVYLDYLKELETKKKEGQIVNKWFQYFTEENAIFIFKKVAIDGLFIDGITITLQFKGKIIVSYDYHAYRNKLLMIYPDSIIDIQLVKENDKRTFKKESGKIYYTHELADPFIKSKIIGAYCIIKNKIGEFLETIDNEDIEKFKNSAKTQIIWNAWFSEMVLKSVIKRACKRHFYDIFKNIETIDNENYTPENVNLDFEFQKQIENAKCQSELSEIYKKNINKTKDKEQFIKLLTDKKIELKNANI